MMRLLTGLAVLIVLMALAVSLAALSETRSRAAALERDRLLAETRHGPIEYADWGAGPAVLVLHGAGGGFDQGRLLARALGGDGWRYIAVSRFGYLGSPLPENASVTAQAEALADLLEGLGLSRVHVLAMSGGVPPALKLAELFPEKVRAMALLSPAPFTPFGPDVEARPVPTWVYQALLGNDVAYWTLTKIARGALMIAFDARPELRAAIPAEEAGFVDALIDGFLPASRRVPGVMNEGAAVDPQAEYRIETIAAPLLVVHARDDRLNPFAVGETMAARAPDATFMALETGGHLLLGHHSALRAEIDGFFRRAGDPASIR